MSTKVIEKDRVWVLSNTICYSLNRICSVLLSTGLSGMYLEGAKSQAHF